MPDHAAPLHLALFHRTSRIVSSDLLLSFLGEQMGGAIAYSELAADHSKLREKTLQIREQLEVRKLTERAKGILQERFNLSEREAYQRLRNESQRLRKPLRAIVEAVLLVEELVQNDHSSGNHGSSEEDPR